MVSFVEMDDKEMVDGDVKLRDCWKLVLRMMELRWGYLDVILKKIMVNE